MTMFRKNYIGTFLITKTRCIYLIEDYYKSKKGNSHCFLLWNLKKHEYLPILCMEVGDGKKFQPISAEEANKITLKFGYDCMKKEYFLTPEMKEKYKVEIADIKEENE